VFYQLNNDIYLFFLMVNFFYFLREFQRKNFLKFGNDLFILGLRNFSVKKTKKILHIQEDIFYRKFFL